MAVPTLRSNHNIVFQYSASPRVWSRKYGVLIEQTQHHILAAVPSAVLDFATPLDAADLPRLGEADEGQCD